MSKMMLFFQRGAWGGQQHKRSLTFYFGREHLQNVVISDELNIFPENYDSDNIELKITIYPTKLHHLIFIKRFLIESINPAKNPMTHNFRSVARVGQTGRSPLVFQEFKSFVTVIQKWKEINNRLPSYVIQFWLCFDRNNFKWIVNVAQTKN